MRIVESAGAEEKLKLHPKEMSEWPAKWDPRMAWTAGDFGPSRSPLRQKDRGRGTHGRRLG
jgi:hypothetical protein